MKGNRAKPIKPGLVLANKQWYFVLCNVVECEQLGVNYSVIGINRLQLSFGFLGIEPAMPLLRLSRWNQENISKVLDRKEERFASPEEVKEISKILNWQGNGCIGVCRNYMASQGITEVYSDVRALEGLV